MLIKSIRTQREPDFDAFKLQMAFYPSMWLPVVLTFDIVDDSAESIEHTVFYSLTFHDVVTKHPVAHVGFTAQYYMFENINYNFEELCQLVGLSPDEYDEHYCPTDFGDLGFVHVCGVREPNGTPPMFLGWLDSEEFWS